MLILNLVRLGRRSVVPTCERYLSSSLAQSLEKVNGKLYLSREEEAKTVNSVLPVLFGWAFAEHKALCKYATVYNELGLPAVCFTPSMWSLWFSGIGLGYCVRVFSAISKNVSQPTSIVLHMFSGAPGAVLPFVSSHLPLNLRLQAVVFDSPVLFSERAGMAAGNQALEQGVINQPTYYAACGIGKTVHTLFGSERRELDKESRESSVLEVPQLYLYSEQDVVALPEEVEEIINEQTTLGRTVEKIKWKDSEHVKHLLQHPKEYCTSISSFLTKYNIILK